MPPRGTASTREVALLLLSNFTGTGSCDECKLAQWKPVRGYLRSG